MSLWNTIIVALIALKRNPTRALLTTLGIMIGIAAVITMMEIGRGSSNSIRSSIEKMGANSVTIMPGWVRVGGVSQGASSRVSLLPADAEAIGRECPSVAYYSPLVFASGNQVIYGSNNWVPNRIVGSAPDYIKIANWEIAEGRCFSERELNYRASVCLVGSTVVRELFDGMSPIDCEIRIRNTTFRVIGVLKSKGASMNGSDTDDIGGWGGNGWGNNNGMAASSLGAQATANANAEMIMNAINGTDADVRLLATTLNGDVDSIRLAINTVQGAIQTVGAQLGLTGQQIINALQMGDANIAQQICQCYEQWKVPQAR